MTDSATGVGPLTGATIEVPEVPVRLCVVAADAVDPPQVASALRDDRVVLVTGLDAARIDPLMRQIAEAIGLADTLEVQAQFAGFFGHRHNVGEYFMSVNKRGDYQFIAPHSEGDSFLNIQLAAFYCAENTTDGGETLLMNVDDASPAWQRLRERRNRVRLGTTPAPHHAVRAKGLYRVRIPEDILQPDDVILAERPSAFGDMTIVDVLARAERTHSQILGREVYAYWDTVSTIDHDSLAEFGRLLQGSALLKMPPAASLLDLDTSASCRVWRSGVSYAELFKARITRKLAPGDLVVQNNLTWTHAVSNWSPGSGVRNVAGAFA